MKRLLLAAILILFLSIAVIGAEKEARIFRFRYSVEVKGKEDGKLIRIWIPLPQSSPYQEVKESKLILKGQEEILLEELSPGSKIQIGDLSLSIHKEPVYSNLYAYGEIKSHKGETYLLVFEAVIHRKKVNSLQHPQTSSQKLTQEELEKFLKANKKVPVGHPKIISHIREALDLKNKKEPISISKKVSPKEALKKARRIYDYIYDQLKYDKSGFGWGRGDALWACDNKRGNCTDFHSLFISMMRTLKIPARFEIGFPLPSQKKSGKIKGYHCWGWFYIKGIGWIPVDISEADKHPEKKEFFFGGLDPHRVAFSTGRDLKLKPAPQNSPINFFIYPIVEMDGKAYPFKREFSFYDLN
ncbi:MAG: hypothetical protein D6785_02795 [Planctomycetota bacterium]|nr:MAG: hypothetical protein D6785_02795 [Planctomycetota bacterium]